MHLRPEKWMMPARAPKARAEKILAVFDQLRRLHVAQPDRESRPLSRSVLVSSPRFQYRINPHTRELTIVSCKDARISVL